MKLLKLFLVAILTASVLTGMFAYGYVTGEKDAIPLATDLGYLEGRIDALRELNMICSQGSRLNFSLPEGTTPYYKCMPESTQPQQQTPNLNRIHPGELQVSI